MVNSNNDYFVLTKRALEVLELLSKGYTTKEIGLRLNIKDSTVIFHRNKLRTIFKAKNTAELISKAYEYFYLKPPKNES